MAGLLLLSIFLVLLPAPVTCQNHNIVHSTIHPALSLAGIGTALKFILPNKSNDEWTSYNCDLNNLLKPVHSEIASNSIDTNTGGNIIIATIRSFLRSKPEFQSNESSKPFTKKNLRSLKRQKVRKMPYVNKPRTQQIPMSDQKCIVQLEPTIN